MVEIVHVPAQFVPAESPQAKHLCHLHVQLLGLSCYKQKKTKKTCIYVRKITSVMSTLCYPVDCGLPAFSVRGVLQARILGCILANTVYASRAL